MRQGVFLKSCLEPQLLHHADRPVHVLDLLWNILCVFVLTLIVAGLSVVCVCVCVCVCVLHVGVVRKLSDLRGSAED